jgi:hypothetical protein
MGLTESKIKDLQDKGFDKLYEKHHRAWSAMVTSAIDFAKKNVSPDPRPDDILKVLLPMLEVNQQLRDHQEEVHARYKRFREYFGDYIIDMELGGKK